MKNADLDQVLHHVDNMVIWCSGAVVLHSVVLPCLAGDSRLLIEDVLPLVASQQILLLLIGLATPLSLTTALIASASRSVIVLGASGWVLILLSIQPASSCCNKIAGWLTGSIDSSQVSWMDLTLHGLPILGGSLLILAVNKIAKNRPKARSRVPRRKSR